jgi:hypothetical protein
MFGTDFTMAVDDLLDPVPDPAADVLKLMTDMSGTARVWYATYDCRVHTDCEFTRLCAYAKSCASAEGMISTVIPARGLSMGISAPIAKKAKKTTSPQAKTKTKATTKAKAAVAQAPLAFTLKGCGVSGKAAVKVYPSFHVTVCGHIDSKGIAVLNARIQRIIDHAATFLIRGSASRTRTSLTMGAVETLQIYWFTRVTIDLQGTHERIQGLMHATDPACPWRQAAVDHGKRPTLRLSTKDALLGDSAAVSATVQPCGTIAIVTRCIPALRRAVMHFAETVCVTRRPQSQKDVGV